MPRILIIEDDPFLTMELEAVLLGTGWEVCGTATSQMEALKMGEKVRPSLAIVDVRLSPGDGRLVAVEFIREYGSAVLMATGNCHEFESLAATGALACIPKPYPVEAIPAALRALIDLKEGRPVQRLPAHMFRLGPLAAKPDPMSGMRSARAHKFTASLARSQAM